MLGFIDRWVYRRRQRQIERAHAEAYAFCQRIYAETNGVTPALRDAYLFYLENYKGDGNDPNA